MTGNKQRSYKNKCGSCQYFAFRIRHGDTRSNGVCSNPKRVNYHDASQTCKLYKENAE